MRGTVVGLAIIAIVAACEPAALAPRARGGGDGSPVRGGRVVEGSFTDAKTFAPFLVNDAASQTVSGLVYDPLFRVDAKTGEITPNLGTWTVSPDGLTYRWRMQPGAIWSDGRPVIGEDYLTAVKAIARSKKTVRTASFQEIEGFDEYRAGSAPTIRGITVDPLDPRSFSVRFKRVYCPALTNAFGAAASPLPAHIYGKYLANEDAGSRIDDVAENQAPPVSSGAFLYKSWRPGYEIVLSRNDSYFRGTPYLDEYVLKVVADTTTLATQLRSGEINLGTIEPKDFDDIKKRDTLRVYAFQENSYNYIGWNTKSASTPGLGDKRVRQALAYGLDMNAIVQGVLYGQAIRQYQHHIVSSWASAEQSTLQLYQYDKRKAEDLIRAAGFTYGPDSYYQKDGKRLELTVLTNSGNRVREAILQAAIDQYKLIGVKVNPRLVPFDAMVDTLSSRSEDVSGWIIGWKLAVEPDPYGIWHSSAIPDPARKTTGFNFGAFTTPELDKAIDAGRTPASAADCSQVARKKAYETVNRILNDEQPYDFGYSPMTLLAATRELHGFDPGTYATYGGVEKWWLGR